MRKLATIRTINNILQIPNADSICVYVVDGWHVVDKIGKFHVNENVVFVEVDSFIPHDIAPFLTAPDRFPKEYMGIQGEKLRTKKLRGVISQGLVLPLSVLGWDNIMEEDIGLDVSDRLSIVKYEPPVSAQLAGQAKGNFPSLIPKTDEERVQNLTKQWKNYQSIGLSWEVTEKLEGSSCTMYMSDAGEFEVCSRNLSLKENPDNSFWKMALQYNVREKMQEAGLLGYAIQGELIGEGVQGNIYNLKGLDFYCFTIYSTAMGRYLVPSERKQICEDLGIKHTPVLFEDFTLSEATIQEVLEFAEGKSVLNPKQEREGMVFKCNENTQLHFKAVSNKYLLKAKD